MRFGYLRDPLFLVCFAVYWINRLLEDYGRSTDLAQFYLNDLICIPFLVPMMLWTQSILRLRKTDAPPMAHEVVIPLLLWIVIFEIVLPITPTWRGHTFADPYDVVSYAVGAYLAMLFWNWWYR